MSKKTKADPTGQARNRNRGTRQLSSRLTKAERDIKALFRTIPRKRRTQTRIQNAEQTVVYDYEYTATDQADLSRTVDFILSEQLLETQTGEKPFRWYWEKNIELPYRQGTLEEVRDFNQLILAAIAAGVLTQVIPAEQVLFSESYRAALDSTYTSNFNTIKSLSEKTASQVIQRINSGIEAGDTPTLIANDISNRFDVSRSDAKRISDTEINKAYNNAKLDATRLLGERSGLRAAVLHISALSTTTRPHHADRHGNAYTVDDQTQWWNTGANRINCKCTTQSILIDRKGNVVDGELQDEIKAERSFFD